MALTKTPVVLPTMLSPLGKACARMDLTAVHDILLKTGYKDEEGAENEVRRSVLITYTDYHNHNSINRTLLPRTFSFGITLQRTSCNFNPILTINVSKKLLSNFD